MFSIRYRVVEAEELLDTRYLERSDYPVADAYQREPASFFVLRHVGADESADAGRVDIRNAGEIHDKDGCVFSSDGSLELEQSLEDDGSLETQDTLAWLGTVEVFDTEGFLRLQWHPEILAVPWRADCYKNVNSASKGADIPVGTRGRAER